MSDCLHRAQDRLLSRDRELEELKKWEVILNAEVVALKEDQALTWLTSKAALMRQHVKGLNPMAQELDTFLTFGSHDDLDKDDEINEE